MRTALVLCLLLVAAAPAPAKKKTPIEELRDTVAALQREVAELKAQVKELQSRLAPPSQQSTAPSPSEIKVGMKVADAEKAASARGYTYERKRFERADGTAEIWYVEDGPYSRIQINNGVVSEISRRD
jgi:uncharacterized coiled-coil protein SlyX